MLSKHLYWIAVAVLIALAFSIPSPDAVAVKCSVDGKSCEQRHACKLDCKRCATDDKCCCRHRDTCKCVDPSSGEPCCP